jgi:uncharacterized protein (TIGR03067 family)
MPDDFQSQLPADGLPQESPKPLDRFANVSLCKPENAGFGSRWIFITLAATFILVTGIFGLFLHRWYSFMSLSGGASNTAPVSVAAPVPARDDGRADRRALEDTWLATEVIVNGEPATATTVSDVRLELLGKFFLFALPRGKQEGEWLADFDTNPKRIEFIPEMGPNLLAIYRINGNTMVMCFETKDFPTDFTAEKGSGRTLLKLRRWP